MKFVIGNKEINEKIKNELNIVCNEILSSIKNVKSIILAGSFGHGEGTVKIKAGELFPFNDYDLYVIADKTVSSNLLDAIASKISKKIGRRGIELFYAFNKAEQDPEKNFYLDIKVLTPEKLKKLLPRFRYYELRNATTLLFGEDLRNLIPNYKVEDVPLSEAVKLLLDRMSQLMEYYSVKGNHSEEFLIYLFKKAHLACSSSLLLISKKYKPTYKEAVQILSESYKKDFPELYKKIPKLPLRIEKFVNWDFNKNKLNKKQIKEAWFQCRNDIFEVAKYFFGFFLKKKITTDYELSLAISNTKIPYYKPYLKSIIKNNLKINSDFLAKLGCYFIPCYFKWMYLFRVKAHNKFYPRILLNTKSPDLLIFSAMPLLLFALEKNKVDQKKLADGVKILKKVYPVTGKDWEEISLDYANAYIDFFLQKIG